MFSHLISNPSSFSSYLPLSISYSFLPLPLPPPPLLPTTPFLYLIYISVCVWAETSSEWEKMKGKYSINENLSPSCRFFPVIFRSLPSNTWTLSDGNVTPDTWRRLQSDKPGQQHKGYLTETTKWRPQHRTAYVREATQRGGSIISRTFSNSFLFSASVFLQVKSGRGGRTPAVYLWQCSDPEIAPA